MFETEGKMRRIYVIEPKAKETTSTRLVRCDRVRQAEAFVLADFAIRLATQEECVRLGAEGVKVEDPAV